MKRPADKTSLLDQIQGLFVDTSFFAALGIADDVHHQNALPMATKIEEHSIKLYTTWEIVAETITLLRYRGGYSTATEFIHGTLPALEVVETTPTDRRAAITLFEKLSRDKLLSYCDLISYMVVTQHLDNMPCLAFDDDFKRLGLIVIT